MKKILLIALGCIALLAVGSIGGYYYREREEMALWANAMVVDRSLQDARTQFAVLRLLEKGETQRAKDLSRSLMLGALHVASVSASITENNDLKQKVNETFQKVLVHYQQYPKAVENDALWKSMKEAISKGELEIKQPTSN